MPGRTSEPPQPDQRTVQIVQQAERDLAVGHFANPVQVGVHAGQQNCPQISQVHEMLGKQVAAVFFDELLQAGPLFFIADGFEHRKPHAPAVRKPAAQQGFGGLFQQGDQFVVDKLFIRAARRGRPIGRRRDQRSARWTCNRSGKRGRIR